jgi:hypothetical protein
VVIQLQLVWRALSLVVGLVLMAVGFVGALLPTHLLGIFMLVGLILVLRSSFSWKRRFVRMKRRYPRFVHPLRRLLRRDPEVWPVIWHELLRAERILPRKWRRLRRWRRGFARSRRAAAVNTVVASR